MYGTSYGFNFPAFLERGIILDVVFVLIQNLCI